MKKFDKLRVYTAARIHTMDEGRPHASAVAVANGRIVSVGNLESMQPWLKRYPHEVDERFANKVITPGFIDPHTHLRMSGTFMGLHYVGPVESPTASGIKPALADVEQVINELRRLTQGQADRSMPITAWGFDPASQGGHLDRDLLDSVSSTVPLWVVSYAPHIVYVNTPMLALIGVR